MSQTETRTYEALVKDTRNRMCFLRKSPAIVFDILNGDRPSLFALVCFLVSALFWSVHNLVNIFFTYPQVCWLFGQVDNVVMVANVCNRLCIVVTDCFLC
jgi:hypothetical protein